MREKRLPESDVDSDAAEGADRAGDSVKRSPHLAAGRAARRMRWAGSALARRKAAQAAVMDSAPPAERPAPALKVNFNGGSKPIPFGMIILIFPERIRLSLAANDWSPRPGRRLHDAGTGSAGGNANDRGQSSMREPMMTVLSRGSLKYSAASAVSRAVAMNRRLRHRLMPGAVPMRTSMVDRK